MAHSSGKRNGRRPNILYLMSDQQKASAASFYGNAHVPTRFMQEMADAGVAFADAYATNPICTPSRASVFTGVHPLVHQVTCHQNRAPYNLPQLSELLAGAGYYTATAGHYEHDRALTRGWHEQTSMQERGALNSALLSWYGHGRRDVGWSSGSLEYGPEEGHAHWLTTRAIHMLDELEAVKEPFFLHVAYLEPHPPYFASPPYDTMVDPDALTAPDQGSDERRPAWQLIAREQMGTALATDLDIRNMIAVYYGMIAYVDDQMRRLYEAMMDRGLLDNTWIIIGCDHGDYTGEKGLFTKSESLYECLLHVPLIIVPPAGARWPQGKLLQGLVDHVDLFPTVLELAGVPVPEYAQGKDLVSWVSGDAREPLRDVVFAQAGDYHGGLKTTMPSGIPEAGRHPGLLQGARSAEFSYIRDPDYGDEAYDLRIDPRELANILGDGSREPLQVAALRRRVDLWEEECLRLRARLGVRPGYRGFDGNQ